MYVADSLAWIVALTAATATRLSTTDSSMRWAELSKIIALAIVATIVVSMTRRFHADRARRGSLDDAQNTVVVWAFVSTLVIFSNEFVFDRPLPRLAALLSLPLALVMLLGGRLIWRMIYEHLRKPGDDADLVRVIVFGAGEGGEQIIRAMRRDPDSAYLPVAVLDDAEDMSRRSILGVPGMGTRNDLQRVAEETRADELLIAIPSAGHELIRELQAAGIEADLAVRILPSTTELLGMLDLRDIRELTAADLLGRSEVTVDLEGISHVIGGQRVLVTGAGGSIGSELCRQISQFDPAELFMLDRDETALHGLQLSMEGKALLDTPNLVVADVRDAERVNEVFGCCRPDIVFHAAALKHLTLLENNPGEGVKTNVWGTSHLLDTARRHGVSRFVNVSTDKAADPTSVLGATKLLAERLTTRAANESGLPYVSVRFGNVLDSRGSVLPTFREQIAKGGPITVTHPEVTRYFMTIPEAVRLVLQSSSIGRQGEIMILDMGEPVKILDLANQLIEQSGTSTRIEFTGLRSGEKLHEILVGRDEVGATREHPRVTHTAGSSDLDVGDMVGDQLADLIDLAALRAALDQGLRRG